MSKLLIQDRPIMILPTLAIKIGLNESIILQQIHYWLLTSKHDKDGKKWVYNTYKEWQMQMPFWSETTIKRTIKSLEDQGLLLSANYNSLKLDKTKWYTIDYEKLAEMEDDGKVFMGSQSGRNGTSSVSDWPNEEAIMDKAIPESTTKSSSKNSTKKEIPFSEIISYLNKKINSNYRATTKKTKDLITARWNEGFAFEDFKRVIDLKTDEWLDDPKWNKYLRPETLFGSKFEAYCNQKSGGKALREEDFNLDD
jgi:uncharacterized phage protein (TIGR02220 family)